MRPRVMWADQPPERLMRFDVSDWPTEGNVREAFSLWREARGLFWAERHSWPTGFVGFLTEQIDEDRRLFGWIDGQSPLG